MAEHSVFAFSASPRWIPCAGSMAYPANLVNTDGGKYANLGTAKHEVSAGVLTKKLASAESVIGVKIKAGADEFIIDDEFAQHVNYYTDEIERRALGAMLMVEQKVSLHGWEGFTKANYGTSDAIIAHEAKIADETTGLEFPAYGEVCDAKFGSGVKVYAWEYAKPNDPFTMDMFPEGSEEPTLVVPNYQLMMYAVASLKRIELLVGTVSHINIVIIQPPFNSISELRVPRAVLERFALFAAQALKRAEHAKALGWDVVCAVDNMLKPGEKQCTWCKAFATCPAAAKRVESDVAADFDVVMEAPPIATDTKALGKYFAAVPFVTDWCKAVLAEVNSAVSDGKQVVGSDGQPLKFVEGDLGDRKWESEEAAKDALLGVLPFDKVYAEPKVISAPAAANLLDKKATKQTWKDIFEPMIKRAPGRPKLALGSDPRPPYIPVATSDEFEVQE